MDNASVNRDPETIATYAAICQTFAEGVVRLIDAECAFCEIMHGLTTYKAITDEKKQEQGHFAEVFVHFDAVSPSQFWAAQYIDVVSTLVYASSLFDTFLNETTIFLFLLIPSAMGKNHQVPLRSLIEGQSRSAILAEVAKQRGKEVSYKSFAERLRFLRETFGLSISLSEAICEALDKFTELRNSVVHDQGFFALSIDDSGCITHTMRGSRSFPSEIDPSDSLKAEKVFRFIALKIAKEIFAHVLRAEVGGIPSHLERFIDRFSTTDPAVGQK
jgi:hypothetical protein